MRDGKAVQLLLNGEDHGHGHVVEKLLKRAERLECLVAFVKTSALGDLLTPLRKALERGLRARFAVSLDFYLTEPKALRQLLALAETHALGLYLSNTSDTFHPKVYAFQYGKQCSVIVGSANLTHGGLYGNYEASVLVDDADGALMASVTQHFDALVEDEMLVPATKARIDAYEREYVIHDTSRKVAKKRAQKVSRAEGADFTILADLLDLMKSDDSEHGFTEQNTGRKRNLRQAKRRLAELAALSSNVRRDFPNRYDTLIGLFHSGGLHRGKSRIANYPGEFVAAVADILGRRNLSPSEAFAVLHRHFDNITGAGINLLTEILHTQDNKRFAVMNQNAVSGLALAGIRDYPLHPTKQNVNADSYARYCEHADAVRRSLGLDDFTELDALFNYAYWRDAEE
jgi:HKD family nuclease